MSKKKTGRSASPKKSGKGLVTVLVMVLLLLVALVAAMLLSLRDTEPGPAPVQTAPIQTEVVSTEIHTPETEAAMETEAPVTPQTQNYGFQITDMGGYTGMYMEDGTDEIVSGVLMLVVENTGDKDIQYAEITMDFAGQQAQFSLTTLPVGEKMVLLEKNRLQWDASMDAGTAVTTADNVAYFQESISTMEDKLKIGIMDGAINVTNISGEDIPGNIAVYYKNAASDIYYGGITYRIQIQGGLKAGEIRQVMTQHASDTGSRIMFVTIGA